MKHIKKNLIRAFVAIFILNFICLINISVAKATMWEDVSNQMGALSITAGYSSDGGAPQSIEGIVANIIQYLLSFLGVLFIILIIYAGFLWMTAAGDMEQITKAKDILISAVIGIIIVLSAYIITAFVLSRLGGATGTG
jgi:hypothetical protein